MGVCQKGAESWQSFRRQISCRIC